MSEIYLMRYAVKGIKSLENWVELSFYKKTINKDFSIKNYNIKAIYGMNGSGKSGIITSARILKSILLEPDYLANPLTQVMLSNLICKKTNRLDFNIEFFVNNSANIQHSKMYCYQVSLGLDKLGKFTILEEELSSKATTAHSPDPKKVFHVTDGEITYLSEESSFSTTVVEKTKNLLSKASLTAIFFRQITRNKHDKESFSSLILPLIYLSLFAMQFYVYLDSKDDRLFDAFTTMFPDVSFQDNDENYLEQLEILENHIARTQNYQKLIELSPNANIVSTDKFDAFEREIHNLESFLRIFQQSLQKIEIEKKIEKDIYLCRLIMKYEGYSIDAEYESTGIKKLMALFPFFQKMADNSIVFIDELDSNLHDVYLCALLEYFMEYGRGQLCFTTHNIGPMDVLKRSKKSIDFLSNDGKVYSWTTSGNYSPSKLYRNGMIEGSPFNVDSVDFLSIFQTDTE